MPKVKESAPGLGDSFDVDFDVDEVTGTEAYAFSDRVIDEAKRIGIAKENRPRIMREHTTIFPDMKVGQYFDGCLPTVIRTLSLDQVSALYSLFSSWYSYVAFQTKKVAAQRSQAGAQKELIWSMVRQQKRYDDEGKKRDVSTMNDEAHKDRRFIEIDSAYKYLDSLYDLLSASTTTTSNDLKVISREITIRQIEIEQNRTKSRFGGRLRTRQFQEDYEDGVTAEKISRRTFDKPAKAARRPVVKNRLRVGRDDEGDDE